MKSFSVTFTIKSEKNCPLYDAGEQLLLSEKTLSCPEGKEVCLILVRDLTALLFEFLQNQPVDLTAYKDKLFNCSGCKGLIKFEVLSDDDHDDNEPGSSKVDAESDENTLLRTISGFEIFAALKREVMKTLVDHFSRIQLENDAYLLKKGEENQNIYFLESGQLIVEEDQYSLTTLERGDICGEMSYLGGDTAVSSVRAVGDVVVLAISGIVFGQLLGKEPDIQSYMARLFANRLRKTTEVRNRELSSCMTGIIDEIVPAEILQIFHMHQKTGELLMDLPFGAARICYNQGQIVRAEYAGDIDVNAVYSVLRAKSGTYRFMTGLQAGDVAKDPIADFMMLLMEGVRLADEKIAGED